MDISFKKKGVTSYIQRKAEYIVKLKTEEK